MTVFEGASAARRACRLRRGLFAMLVLAAAPAQAQPAIEGYTRYEALAAQLKALDESEQVEVTSLAKTLGGRDVFLITIAQGDPLAKPALLLVGNVEAAHLVGSELALRLAQHLAGAKGDPAAGKKLLEQFTIYVIPRPNPDASEHFFSSPSEERAANERPTDDDRDGEVDEDPANDLNGDGQITMMRVEDASGPYMPHPADPRVLIKADSHKNEHGRYGLYSEGRDDDGDEQFNEDHAGGVSFNRNFPHHYAYFAPLSGPHQVSEIETRAVADFAFAHPNIALVFTFSPEDNLLEPWKPGPSTENARGRVSIVASDADHANYLAEQYRQILGAKARSSPTGAGSFSEWAYYQYGRWSLAARGWWIPKVSAKSPSAAEGSKEKAASEETPAKNGAPTTAAAKPAASVLKEFKLDEKEKRGADDLNALAWFKQEGIEGFVDWQVVVHPDFPGKKVEVGGFKPYLRLNPPAKELDPLAEKHFQFLTRLSELMPRVAVATTECQPLGGGVFRLRAVVQNRGFLPTSAAAGRTSGEAYPLQIKIDLPAEGKLLSGVGRSRLETLAGNGGQVERTWLLLAPVSGPQKATVSIHSPSVGHDSKDVELK